MKKRLRKKLDKKQEFIDFKRWMCQRIWEVPEGLKVIAVGKNNIVSAYDWPGFSEEVPPCTKK